MLEVPAYRFVHICMVIKLHACNYMVITHVKDGFRKSGHIIIIIMYTVCSWLYAWKPKGYKWILYHYMFNYECKATPNIYSVSSQPPVSVSCLYFNYIPLLFLCYAHVLKFHIKDGNHWWLMYIYHFNLTLAYKMQLLCTWFVIC